ncbi:MAG: hypothetical protein SNF33_04625 [Candidatus Algichlamydia australiensis]|nr:hypothetical protein [Chlamydiales bacterium]
MSFVVNLSTRWSGNRYCSNGSAPSFCSESVKSIEKILDQNTICIHNVKEIKKVYKKIDGLGKSYIVQLIEKKINSLFSEKGVSADNLIFIYFLQKFVGAEQTVKAKVEKEVGAIDSLLKEKIQSIANKSLEIEKLASKIPCCISIDHFEEDISFLLGSFEQNEKITRILDRKRRRIQAHQEKKQKIQNRMVELAVGSEGTERNCSQYLYYLLDHGYVTLYDHVLNMRAFSTASERRSAVRRISVSELSQIVLEMREAIIKKVESSISGSEQEVLLLLGGTRSGKSTTLSFLRRDEMKLNSDQNYEPIDGRDTIIGHDGAASYTFLPNIEVVDNLIIVDFPGFSDTKGRIIALGAEFALKALVEKYNPKILVIESVTNTDDGYEAIRRLRTRLDRILDKKENCLLGLTKYTKKDAYIRLREIENRQRDELLKPSSEESELEGAIGALSSLNIPDLQPNIEAKKEELAALRRKREERQIQELPETKEKAQCRAALDKAEQELLAEAGLKKIVRLDDLEDEKCLKECLKAVFQLSQGLRVASKSRVSPSDKLFLEKRMTDELTAIVKSEESYFRESTDSVKTFERNVRDFSLVRTVLSHSHPEIGNFLHLPENEPSIVHNFDKSIVEDCIEKYIKYITSQVHIYQTRIELEALESKVSKKSLVKTKKKLNELQKYVLNLLGETFDSERHADEKWKKFQNDNLVAIKNLEEDLERKLGLTGLTKFISKVPLNIPFGIHRYRVNQEKRRQVELLSRRKAEEYIDQEYRLLDETLTSLIKLRGIERLIKSQDAIDKVYGTFRLSFKRMSDFASSIKARVDEVRGIYGSEDWDVRVRSLHKYFKNFFEMVRDKYIPYFGEACLLSLLTYIEQDKNIDFIQIDTDSHGIQRLLEKRGLSESKDCLVIRKNNNIFLINRCFVQADNSQVGTYFSIDKTARGILEKASSLKDVLEGNKEIKRERKIGILDTPNLPSYEEMARVEQAFELRASGKGDVEKIDFLSFKGLKPEVANIAKSYFSDFTRLEEVEYGPNELVATANLAASRAALASTLACIFDATAEAKEATKVADEARSEYASASSPNDINYEALGRAAACAGAIKNSQSYNQLCADLEIQLKSAYRAYIRELQIGRAIQVINKLRVDPGKWIEFSMVDRTFELDQKVGNDPLKIDRVVLTNVKNTKLKAELVNSLSSDQLEISDLWKDFSKVVQELDINLQASLSKALLSALILREWPNLT